MGFRLKIKGSNEEILLEKESIISVKYVSDTPDNSGARATDVNVGLEIMGKVTSEKDDITKKLCVWSLVSSEVEDAYRNVELEVISAGNVIRKYMLPNSFIIDYNENYDVKNGTGTFNLVLKQKKEKISSIVIEGGYSA